MLPIQQPAWKKYEFQYAEQLYMVFLLVLLKVDSISYMLSQFHSPEACKSHSDPTLEIHGADLTIVQSLCYA